MVNGTSPVDSISGYFCRGGYFCASPASRTIPSSPSSFTTSTSTTRSFYPYREYKSPQHHERSKTTIQYPSHPITQFRLFLPPSLSSNPSHQLFSFPRSFRSPGLRVDTGNTEYTSHSQSFTTVGRTPLARVNANGIGGQAYRNGNGMKGMGGGRAVYGRKQG